MLNSFSTENTGMGRMADMEESGKTSTAGSLGFGSSRWRLPRHGVWWPFAGDGKSESGGAVSESPSASPW